jgi:CHAT domain-containing protein/tetratricopeptide (TPR) repeat protein
MKVIFLTSILTLFFFPVYCQLWKIDADNAKAFSDAGNPTSAIERYNKSKAALQKDSSETNTFAGICIKLADLYRNLNKYDSAEQLYIAARVIIKKAVGTENTDYALACHKLGMLYLNESEFEKSEPLMLEAIRIRGNILGKQSMDYAYSVNNLALLYSQMGQYQKAEPFYIESGEIKKNLEGEMTVGYARSCKNLADLYHDMSQYEKAEPLLVKAMQILEKISETQGTDYASSCMDLGSYYLDKGQFEKAKPLLLRAKTMWQTLKGKQSPDYAMACTSLGDLYEAMGLYRKAEPLYQEGKAIREKVLGKSNAAYASSCISLARIYEDMGQFDKAEALSREAKSIREKVLGKNHYAYASACNNLANIYEDMGQYDKAEPLYLEARQIKERVFGKQSDDYATGCSNLAILYQDMGQYDKAEPLYLEAKNIREKLFGKQNADYATSCNNLGTVYEQMGKHEAAAALYEEAINIREKVFGKQNVDYAVSINNLAGVYEDIGEFNKAKPLFLESKAIREKAFGKQNVSYANACYNLGNDYLHLRQYQEAEDLLLQAKLIRGKTLGKRHADYAAACEALGDLYWQMHDPLRSDKEYKESFVAYTNNVYSMFQFTNEKERTSFIKNFLGEDDKEYSFYLSSKMRSAQPYTLSLFHRNLVLSASQALQKQIFSSDDATLKNTYTEWINLKKYLSILYARPVDERKEDADTIEARADQLEKELTRLSTGFKKQRQPVGWKDIQNKLGPGEATIEFISFQPYASTQRTDTVLYAALVLRKDSPLPAMVRLFTEKQLRDLVYAADNNANNNSVKDVHASRGATLGGGTDFYSSLYDLVWRPLESTLAGIKTIYYAPSRALYRISFAALPISKTQVLSDKYRLVQLTSTAAVADLVPAYITASDNLQLYGGIKYDAEETSRSSETSRSVPDDLTRSGSFHYLPGTRSEMDSIRTLAITHQIPVIALSGTEATEESFKALDGKASPSVIHIATHGFFFPDLKDAQGQSTQQNEKGNGILFRQSDNPLFRSGLLFAGSNRAWQGKTPEGLEDGILTAYEVSNMYLPHTKLVILSACQTALGDVEGSEGVYGLQRAFKMSGVQNLVMSLWAVPDAETVEFMQEFYEKLFAGGSVSDAFYQAQTTMKDKYRNDPSKWAAWVLIR